MGLDADLDQFHDTDAAIDWTRWGPEQVRQADKTSRSSAPSGSNGTTATTIPQSGRVP
jgi:hypothetical protein